MRIVVDRHEKDSLIISELVSRNIEVQIESLKVADYIISSELAIERKTVNDFVGSMLSKRLIKQLLELKANYKKPMLIIEGIDEENIYKPSRHPNIHENSIRGMILSVLLNFQVPILLTKDYIDTANYLELLAKKQEMPEKQISLRTKKHAFNIQEQQRMILEGFPGIGPGIARQLLEKFKTIKNFSNASLEDLKKVPKLGKKAEIIKRIIDIEYRKLKD